MNQVAGPSLNGPLARRMIVSFLRVEIKRHGFDRAVLGLSGGLDSAVTLLLTAEALGADQVLALALPYRDSSPESLHLAREMAQVAGVRLQNVPITPLAEPYLSGIPQAQVRRRGNILARLRMLVLYDHSAREQALVVGTSNKSELLLGYSTLHGDAACALLPLGDLYKTQVRLLATHLGVPRAILERPPTADLWVGQTDEQELGFSYQRLDHLLAHMVDRREDLCRLQERGFDAPFISRVRRLIRQSQFKRRLPPIAKLSCRTVGMDFRYPRDWDAWGED